MTNGSMVRAACATSIPVVSAPSSACPSRKASVATFRRRTLSCRAAAGGGGDDNNNDGDLMWVPRRDMMLSSLSGVAAGLAWYPGVASGAADAPAKCDIADKVNDKSVKCTDPAEGSPPCPLEPSPPTDPIDFTPARKVTRFRQPVHRLSRENREKYKEAVARMKALDVGEPTNPLRFAAQAAIHEAYCDAHYRYEQATGGERPFDVHFSWIFAPWHRMYIYFYERALGDLIGDDTFALPYWRWDDPAGMVVPPLFKDKVGNPLYDANRNPDNLDALVDLEYLTHREDPRIPFKGPQNHDYNALVNRNLCTIHRQQVGLGPESFLGGKFCTEGSKTAGTLEQLAHTAMHVWVGKAGPPAGTDCNAETGVPSHIDPKTPFNCRNDMGFLGAAGRDPLFYSHHSNVDRMWHLWSTRLGGGEGITDPDWLDASFVFYDDVRSPRKVRIRFSDVLDTRSLGYTYDAEFDRDLPWLRPKIVALVPHGKDGAPPRAKTRALLKSAPVFPLALSKGQVVELRDLAVPAAKQLGKELLLVIDGVEYDPQAPNKFDVAINVPKDKALQVGPQYKEYAGSFAVVPGTGAGKTQQTKVSLCITNTLNDIDAEDDKTVDVVIVPRTDAKVTLNASPTIQYRN